MTDEVILTSSQCIQESDLPVTALDKSFDSLGKVVLSLNHQNGLLSSGATCINFLKPEVTIDRFMSLGNALSRGFGSGLALAFTSKPHHPSSGQNL